MEEKKGYLFVDFPEFKVTEETRNDVTKNTQKYSNCDARVRMGKFYTYDEHQKKIDEGLNRKLPGQKKLIKIKIK